MFQWKFTAHGEKEREEKKKKKKKKLYSIFLILPDNMTKRTKSEEY